MTAPHPVTFPAAPRRTASGRRGSGELRRQVAHLLNTEANEFTAGEVAHRLGNCSSGAVGNALHTLVKHGHAERTSQSPRRYQRTATTHLAADGAAPPPSPAAAPAAPPPSAPTGPKPPGAVVRPNGMVYRPRELASLPDVEVLRRLRGAGVPALLYGPPGTGKTSMAEAAFADLLTVAGDGDTQVGDLVGEYTQTPGGGFEFVYGPLVRAMQEGRALLIDDATLISPAVLAVVYPAMDGRGELTVTAHKGETITAAEGFYIIAGHNPGVHGAHLTEALASRFAVHIEVTSDYDLARSLGVPAKAVRAARNLSLKLGKGEIGWAPQLRELLAFTKITELLGIETAVANLAGVAPAEDRSLVAAVLQDAFGVPVAPLRLGRQL